MKNSLKITVFCVSLALCHARGFAAAAYTPTTITDSVAPYDITAGWDFQLTQSYEVTALEFYDGGAVTGLQTSHQVALWNESGTVIASAVVPAGTAATQAGEYLSVSITPVILPPGYYEVGGFVPGRSDKYVLGATGTTLPGLIYDESHVATGAFAFPGSQNLVSGTLITANFDAFAVPEPDTAALLGAGMVGIGLLWRRQARG